MLGHGRQDVEREASCVRISGARGGIKPSLPDEQDRRYFSLQFAWANTRRDLTTLHVAWRSLSSTFDNASYPTINALDMIS